MSDAHELARPGPGGGGMNSGKLVKVRIARIRTNAYVRDSIRMKGVLTLILALAIAGGGWFLWQKRQPSSASTSAIATPAL